jgi:hypothetical protein
MRPRIGPTLDKRLSLDGITIAKKTVCILLVRGEDPESTPIYAYVAVRADRLQQFMAAQGTDTFYPEDYGVIIEAGEGEPSDEVRRKMETEYGFDHEAMIGIADTDDAYDIAENIGDKIDYKLPPTHDKK